MKLVEYVLMINGLLKGNGDKEVYYAGDDEGNTFQPVYYSPTIMEVDGEEVVCIN